ncbi:hypothetical protein [Bacillus pretiosus]|uniref:Uncharacterized protein n=1 Tax=Bacillus pretiosus TaxID=2983392 RepID=A0ABT3ERX1_9BACI|nr:hypothetical protein [Bacillus pretiosus]MCW1239099.1 hypothetical protein [Bacillus pretiosus]
MKAYCGENGIKHVAGNKDDSADELHTVIKEATNKVDITLIQFQN